jgi:ribosome recycling factor
MDPALLGAQLPLNSPSTSSFHTSTLHQLTNFRAHPIQIRAFLGTPALTKKKTHKEDHRHGKYNPQDLQNDPPKQNDAPNAFDFAALEREILKSIERMTHRLAELRSGGRLSPSTIEVLPVKLDKESSSTVKIKDLAQVVSKGQYMHIILNDEAVCWNRVRK